jgi:hypothetical protein
MFSPVRKAIMTDNHSANDPNIKDPGPPNLQFGEEIEIEESGFSFKPILGFELEIDGSVYMYSEDGNLEISLVGGELPEDASIAELNDDLAGEFMESFDEVVLKEAGTDTIMDITGFLDEIHFVHAEEAGRGRALICAPYVNQFFFILVISSADHWEQQGQHIYETLKEQIRFHPQFKPEDNDFSPAEHPDLTIETYENIPLDESFLLNIEKKDLSLLMAARSPFPEDEISLLEITGPGGHPIYRYDPETGAFESTLFDQPIHGAHGEACLYLPKNNQSFLQPGQYSFAFQSQQTDRLQEIQVIIRSDKIIDRQAVDVNFWVALTQTSFEDPEFIDSFKKEMANALKQHLLPVNLTIGKMELLHPAPDELETFAAVNIDSDIADCSYMIAESVNNGRALNIGLVEVLTMGEDDQIAYVNAISSGHPGMILAPASPHTCILIAWPVFENDLHALADTIVQQMIVFCGIENDLPQPDQPVPPRLTHEIAWSMRRHPLFYDGD